MRRYLSIAAVILALSVPVPALADVFCSFTMTSLYVTPDSWVSVGVSNGTIIRSYWICPTSASTTANDGYAVRTITSDGCKTIYSQLLTAKVSGKQITLQFHGPADCGASLPADGTQPNPFPSNFGIVQ